MSDEFDFTAFYKIGETVYYLRLLLNLGINDIVEGKIRTLGKDYMVIACGGTKQALFLGKSIRNFIFRDKKEAKKESKKYHVRKVTIDNNE